MSGHETLTVLREAYDALKSSRGTADHELTREAVGLWLVELGLAEFKGVGATGHSSFAPIEEAWP